MYLAFFIIGALDLLGSLDSVPSKDEREDYVNWIYHCQHPDGGFRMWPGTDFGAKASKDNALWDPANVPATYFALTLLLILDDDFKRVKRRETLLWLLRMQRPDGSFGETLVNGTIEGGRDPRFGYCAAGIRYILRGPVEGAITVDGQSMDDVDVDAFVGCVRLAEVGTPPFAVRMVLLTTFCRSTKAVSPTSRIMNLTQAIPSARSAHWLFLNV